MRNVENAATQNEKNKSAKSVKFMKHNVETAVLANGMQGLFVDVPDAHVFGMQLHFRAGSYYAPIEKFETAHLLEHMVLGANSRYPTARAFAAEFQKNGAYMNASTGMYDVRYMFDAADFEWHRVVDEMLNAVGTASLNNGSDFAAEHGNVREELTGKLNQHFRQLVVAANQFFGLTSLDDATRLSQLSAITTNDITNHHRLTHVTQNARFIIAGNLNGRRSVLQQLLEQAPIESGHRQLLPVEAVSAKDEVNYVSSKHVSNVYFYWQIFANQELSTREEDALTMVNTILTAPFYSRILGAARERGLAYHISSGTQHARERTAWWFGAEVSTESAPALFEIMANELIRLRDGKLDDGDVESARNYLIGQHQRGAQTIASIIDGYGSNYFFDEQVVDYYAIPDRYKALSKDDLLTVVQKMLTGHVWGLSILATGNKRLANNLYRQLAKVFV